MNARTAQLQRRTGETVVEVVVNLDGTGRADLRTGIGFLDHLFTALARHARLDVTLVCTGDLHVDDHHTAEDCALSLGAAIDQAIAERRGFARFGYAYAPLDEALARCVLDFSGRPCAVIDLGLSRESIGSLACENITHVLSSIAIAMRASLHVDVLRGVNDHHRAEAAFKAVAFALRMALVRDQSCEVPSTKGVL